MKTNCLPLPALGRLRVSLLVIVASFWGLFPAPAQPTILSTVPANSATGISPTAAVVFTFSEAMNTTATVATFYALGSIMPSATSSAWSAGNTVLTCAPSPSFPANTTNFWIVSGQGADGTALGETPPPAGFFITGSGSGGGNPGTGSGTNAITTFSLGKLFFFDQTDTNPPVVDPQAPYAFEGGTTLASNLTATNVSLTFPGNTMSNLFDDPLAPEDFSFYAAVTNLTNFNATYPAGNYTFNVQSASNQPVTLNFPASLQQPNAPHLSNLTAAQSVDSTRPFLLTWDPFPGATAADYFYLYLVAGDSNVFQTPNPGQTNALSGTATSVQIPTNSLSPGTSYMGFLGFERALTNSPSSNYSTVVFLLSDTTFNLTTTGGGAPGGPLTLTNASWNGGVLTFAVASAVGQTFTIEYSTDLSSGAWNPLLTTNSPTGLALITDPASGLNGSRFYRARNGP